jgi:MFS transporter, DHA1 family, multidrug resistance protein
MLLNARVVEHVGVRRLGHGMMLVYLVIAAGVVGVSALTDGRPPLWGFVLAIAPLLASHALLIPNLNTVAMTHMAPVAGTASSLIGAIQIAVGALLGSTVDRAFDGSILPLSIAFLGYGVVALVLLLWAERGRLFEPLHERPAWR